MESPETHPGALAHDHDLLREYAEGRGEGAFRALVERHSGMVFGVARRLSGSEHAAAEITQSVFLALARKSATLPRAVPLAGWLHTAARYAASHWRRGEARRRERERAASAEAVHAVNAETERAWEEISPWLDAALASLNARDREAVLRRFFEQRSFTDVAAGLGTTEDAAKMRVSRAVRKLRAFLERRGAVLNAAVLTTCLAGHAAATAPGHVVTAAAQLAGPGVAPGAAVGTLANAIGETIRWTRLKRVLATTSAVVVLVAGASFGLLALRTTPDLTAPGAADTLLRESTVLTGTWRATAAGLTADELAWTHLAVRGPFASDYRLQVAYRQQNPAGVVELFLPAGPQMLMVLLPSAANAPADTSHLAEIEVRLRAAEISLAVKLDGVEIAGTKDVAAAQAQAAMVPDQPHGVLGLGAMRTRVDFTRVEAQALPKAP